MALGLAVLAVVVRLAPQVQQAFWLFATGEVTLLMPSSGFGLAADAASVAVVLALHPFVFLVDVALRTAYRMLCEHICERVVPAPSLDHRRALVSGAGKPVRLLLAGICPSAGR